MRFPRFWRRSSSSRKQQSNPLYAQYTAAYPRYRVLTEETPAEFVARARKMSQISANSIPLKSWSHSECCEWIYKVLRDLDVPDSTAIHESNRHRHAGMRLFLMTISEYRDSFRFCADDLYEKVYQAKIAAQPNEARELNEYKY
jgi:hypothetical protein